jgi:hypothetical protein
VGEALNMGRTRNALQVCGNHLIRHVLLKQHPLEELASLRGGSKLQETEHVSYVGLAELQEPARPGADQELRLSDPVEDLKQVVGRPDVEIDRVLGGEVLDVVDLVVCQPELDGRVDPVDQIERQLPPDLFGLGRDRFSRKLAGRRSMRVLRLATGRDR